MLVVLGALVTGGALLARGGSEAPTSAPAAVAREQALVVGDNPDAKVTVVVYEDFLCPYCREFESASRDFLRRDAAQGKVLVEYRPFQLLPDPYSSRALSAWAAVLKQGTPAQALALHDLLYENQPYEAASDKPGAQQLTEWAKDAGVTDRQVLDAIGQEDQDFVKAAGAVAQQAGIKGTPTVLVDGKRLEGDSVTAMADRLEEMIARG